MGEIIPNWCFTVISSIAGKANFKMCEMRVLRCRQCIKFLIQGCITMLSLFVSSCGKESELAVAYRRQIMWYTYRTVLWCKPVAECGALLRHTKCIIVRRAGLVSAQRLAFKSTV